MSSANTKQSRSVVTKALTIQEFKRRLRDNVRSMNDNFYHIIAASKINVEDIAHRNVTGKMTELYTTKNEMSVRAALMVRAGDELLKLTNELKEFLILHDFNFLTHAIKTAERDCEESMKKQTTAHNALTIDVMNLINDIDREIAENFQMRH